MVDAAVFDLDIDDGWALEEAGENEAPADLAAAAPAGAASEEVETDDGWNLDQLAEGSRTMKVPETHKAETREVEPSEGETKPKRSSNPSRIVRLPGRVVIYPRRAVREKKLSALWECALSRGA